MRISEWKGETMWTGQPSLWRVLAMPVFMTITDITCTVRPSINVVPKRSPFVCAYLSRITAFRGSPTRSPTKALVEPPTLYHSSSPNASLVSLLG